MSDSPSQQNNHETATFGAGCFWCVEAVFKRLEGVISFTSGYMGGHSENPTYEEICTGQTGHAEVVQVVYDSAKITFEELLDVFWQSHDPTTLNRQGADRGTQYRSAIFYHSEEQRLAAGISRDKENSSGRHNLPIVTEITPATKIFEAEDYHQDYYDNNQAAPYCRMVISPKLTKLGMN